MLFLLFFSFVIFSIQYISSIIRMEQLCLFQSAAGIIFPIIKAEGVRQMFFPATVPAYYKAPSVKSDI